MPEAPRIARIEDIPALPSAGVGYRLVRRALGVRAFGVNAFTADAGELLIEPHDEMSANAAHHEELYVVVAGRARFTIDGAEHDATAGTLVFVRRGITGSVLSYGRQTTTGQDGPRKTDRAGSPASPYPAQLTFCRRSRWTRPADRTLRCT